MQHAAVVVTGQRHWNTNPVVGLVGWFDDELVKAREAGGS